MWLPIIPTLRPYRIAYGIDVASENYILYTMKVLWQVIQADVCKKLLQNPIYFVLNLYLNGTTLKFYIRSFTDM